MWKTDATESSLGQAVWHDEHGSWSIDARGGPAGIRACAGDLLAAPAGAKPNEWFQFAPVDQAQLPEIAEQFIRGDELHLSFPQGESLYGLRLAIQPIRSSAEYLAIETTISIQTTLLDTHPKLDVVAAGDAIRTLSVDEFTSALAPPISLTSSADSTVAVLLGRHDAPFTIDQSADGTICLRLFGDFLEKGVIRKARPWFVIDRGRKLHDDTIRRLWQELSRSPLPLTS